MYKPSPCEAVLLYFPSPLPCLLGALLTQHGVNTGARGADSPSTYRCRYIGLRCTNFQYGRRKWNNGPLVESRCQTESRNSFLTRTHFPASAQMCVEASDTRQTGREKFDALLSSHSGDIQTLTTACWSWREPRRDSLSSAARQPFSKPQRPHQRSQQIRPADGPRSAQSKGEANSNQLECSPGTYSMCTQSN